VVAQSVERWATGWTIGVLGFDSRRGLGIFLFTAASRVALGPTQPPIQWVSGALSLGVKRPGREANHSLPSSAEIKNAWSYIPLPQYSFMAWCSVNAQGQFYLYFYINFWDICISKAGLLGFYSKYDQKLLSSPQFPVHPVPNIWELSPSARWPLTFI
jgi:hypothetical protein